MEREKAKENFVEEFPASMIPKSETLKEVREGYGCAGTYHYCTDLAELFSIRESNEKEFEVSLQSKETQHSNSPLLAASFTQRTDHSLSQRIKNYEDSTQNSKNR